MTVCSGKSRPWHIEVGRGRTPIATLGTRML
jgi:hypothetical protein